MRLLCVSFCLLATAAFAIKPGDPLWTVREATLKADVKPKAKAVSTVPARTAVHWLEASKDHAWQRVEAAGKTGWVETRALTSQEPQADVARTEVPGSLPDGGVDLDEAALTRVKALNQAAK